MLFYQFVVYIPILENYVNHFWIPMVLSTDTACAKRTIVGYILKDEMIVSIFPYNSRRIEKEIMVGHLIALEEP